MTRTITSCLVFISFLLFTCQKQKPSKASIIPFPKDIHLEAKILSLQHGFRIQTNQANLKPLANIIQEEAYLLSEMDVVTGPIADQTLPLLSLQINPALAEESYTLSISDQILIEGGSYTAVAMGSTTFLQMIDEDLAVQKGKIQDAPKHNYRGLMIDCARAWHPIYNLKQIITLARWYKIKQLHLHLTDDQLFTFQSTAYPLLATAGRSYSQAELKELSDYAFARGITLIPEIDIPAHASQFTKKMPALFGIADLSKNSYTMSMGKEEIYQAMDQLFGEVAQVFQHSPYIHIGGDEAHFDGMAEDPETIAYMAKHEIPSIEELFRHFIIRMNDIVKGHGKKTLVWAGFKRDGIIKIPKDITVMSWEAQYYDPQLLVDDGYPMINASFKPLYIVNNRKWSPAHIYEQWNERRWGYGTDFDKQFTGLEIDASPNILGASMCSWEQSSLVEVRRARKRLAAFSEKIWGTGTADSQDFFRRLEQLDQGLEKLFYPFEIIETGKSFSEEQESNFYEHLRFDSLLTLTIKPRFDNIDIRYALADETITDTSALLTQALLIDKNTTVKVQAFQKNGRPLGHPFYNKYFYHPLSAEKIGLEIDRLPSSWERLRFKDQLKVVLKSPHKNSKIQYTLQRNNQEDSTGIYEQAILLNETTHLSAKLLNEQQEQIGSSVRESYYLLKEESCLTSGKPISASNDRLRPGMAKIANNGRVSLWEHWSDHTNGNNWLLVDLEQIEQIKRFQVHCFWDNYRYYQYTIEISKDGKEWTEVVDFSNNEKKSSIDGYVHEASCEARYLRLNVLHNSANPGLHITEFCAY